MTANFSKSKRELHKKFIANPSKFLLEVSEQLVNTKFEDAAAQEIRIYSLSESEFVMDELKNYWVTIEEFELNKIENSVSGIISIWRSIPCYKRQ